MPTRKGNPPQKKRQQITDQTGWTHVVRGPKQAAANPKDLSQAFQDLTFSTPLSPEEVSQQQDRYERAFTSSQCCAQLQRIFANDILPVQGKRHLRIRKCICLGLGSFTSGREASRYQLATLTWLLAFLQSPVDGYNVEEVVFQDPAFNESDITFLERLGYRVVDTPSAFDMVDDQTVLFAPHLEKGIYCMAIERALPALCVGSEISGFVDDGGDVSQRRRNLGKDSEGLVELKGERERERNAFKRFDRATASVPMPEFEKDMWCYFTRIFWLKGEDGDGDRE